MCQIAFLLIQAVLVIFDSAAFDLRVKVPAKRTNTLADPNECVVKGGL